MHITIISTSPRKNSNSLRLAKYLSQVVAEQSGADIHIVDFEDYDFPFVGQGSLDVEHLSDFQKTLISAWEKADLVFFTIPEYNYVTSGQFVNMLHLLGNKQFGHLFDEKVFALAGVSSGRGGRIPTIDGAMVINKLISFMGKFSIISPSYLESHDTGKNLAEDGNSLGNERYEQTTRNFVAYALEMRNRFAKANVAVSA